MSTRETVDEIDGKAEKSFQSPTGDMGGLNSALDEVYALYKKDPKQFSKIIDQMVAEGKADPTKPEVNLISDPKTGEPLVVRMAQGKGDHSQPARGRIGMDLTFGEKGEDEEDKLPHTLEAQPYTAPPSTATKETPQSIAAKASAIEGEEQQSLHTALSNPKQSDAAMRAAFGDVWALYRSDRQAFDQVTTKMHNDGVADPTKPQNKLLTDAAGEPQALLVTQGTNDHLSDSTAEMSFAFTAAGKQMIDAQPPLVAQPVQEEVHSNHTILPGR